MTEGNQFREKMMEDKCKADTTKPITHVGNT